MNIEHYSRFKNAIMNFCYLKIEPASRSKNANGFNILKNQFIIVFLERLAVQYLNNQFMNDGFP